MRNLLVVFGVLVIVFPARALSPLWPERLVPVFRDLTKMDEATYSGLKTAFKRDGLNGLKRALEDSKSMRDDAARGVLYMRIAVEERSILPADEAAGMIERLYKVPGFSRATSALLNTAPGAPKGALQELRIADSMTAEKYVIQSIRYRFRPENLKRESDVDIIFSTGQNRVAVESKAFAGQIGWTQISTDVETLTNYVLEHPGTIPCFVFENEPAKLVKEMLESKNIAAVWGSPAMAKFCTRPRP